jgi:hypothetical protein
MNCSHFIKVTLPIQPIIELNEFANFKVNGRQKDATIQKIFLMTSYRTPFSAIIKIYAIKDNGISFSKEFPFDYTYIPEMGSVCLNISKDYKTSGTNGTNGIDSSEDDNTCYFLNTSLLGKILNIQT